MVTKREQKILRWAGWGVTVAAFLCWALVRVALWEWFVTPFGLPPINLFWSAGLGCLLASFGLTASPTPPDNTDLVDLLAWMIARGLAYPLVLLVIGWLCAGLGGPFNP